MSCLIKQFSNGMLVYQSTYTKKKKKREVLSYG